MRGQGRQARRITPHLRAAVATVAFAAAIAALTAQPAAAQTTAAQPTANPPWPAQCPLELGLLVDQSSSMSARFGDVRTATGNVVDALRDKRSEVTVVGFGSGAEVTMSAVDVSDDGARRGLKEAINDLDPHGGDGGATNWEAALTAVRPLGLDVVVLVTDGVPTALGNPPRNGVDEQEPLVAAATVADQMKNAGTRIVAVGIDLQPGADQNLAAVTGPARGQDYYPSDTAGLLRNLYEIVASACGVPQAALPRPEPPSFPLAKTITGALVALLLLMLLAYALHRKRGGIGPRVAAVRSTRRHVPDPTIDHQDLRDDPAPATHDRSGPVRRSRSLDFLSGEQRNEAPPRDR